MNERKNLLGESGGFVEHPPSPTNLRPPFPLRDIWPEVIDRIKNLLTESGDLDLAASIDGLQVYDRCRCGQNYCALVLTQPPSNGADGATHRGVVFGLGEPTDPDTGKRIRDTYITSLHVVDEVIVRIEILDDHESRRRLIMALPDLPKVVE
jgi:hypothetical protein